MRCNTCDGLDPVQKTVISSTEWRSFLWRFFDKEFPHQRLGQAFLNNFKVFDEMNKREDGMILYGKIFNEVKNGKAITMIEHSLIKWD